MSESTFTKWHGPTVTQDVRRLKVLAQICSQVEGVVTAPVRQVNIPRQEVVFDRLDLRTPLIQVVKNHDSFAQVGRLLARMHMAPFSIAGSGFSSLPCPMIIAGIAPADAALLVEAIPSGWFHSDFWHGNVFVLADERVVILDPLPADFMFPQDHILACGALDAATMYMGLLVRHPLRKQVGLDAAEQVDAAEAFLEAYLHAYSVYSNDVVCAVRRVAYQLAKRWVSEYSVRLRWPISTFKELLTMRSLSAANKIIGWEGK